MSEEYIPKFEYYEAPTEPECEIIHDSVFLAGGITNCEDWQSIVVERLKDLIPLKVFNPRRKNWPTERNPKDTFVQIEWEYRYLHLCEELIFWFTDDTIQPIVLYELGGALERSRIENKLECWEEEEYLQDPNRFHYSGQVIFIGADPKYTRFEDVKIQAALSGYPNKRLGYPLKIYTSLDELIDGYRGYRKYLEAIYKDCVAVA